MYQSQSTLESREPKRARSLRKCHGVSWKQLLPSSWAEFAIAPIQFDIFREFEIAADRTIGYDDGYTMKHGKTCMRVRHFPFDIDEMAREIWLSCLWQALEETEWPSAVREEYWNWMEPFSIRMINRRTFRSQPKRYPFDRVKQPQRRAPFAVCPR